MSYTSYIESVFKTYQHLKVNNKLSDRLTRPTPAGIREECKEVCIRRFSKKDGKILRTYFRQDGDRDSVVAAIEIFKTGHFKSLVNYLEQRSKQTSDKNIELLAWLIDFQPRPFELGRVYEPQLKEKKETEIVVEEEISNTGETKVSSSIQQEVYGKPYYKKGKKRVILVGIILLLLLIGGYSFLLSKKTSFGTVMNGRQSCMYWTGDHYEPISCNPHHDTVVVALDSVKLNGFRKITTPDTISFSSIGKVWYIKRNKKLEYYTADGSHPTDPNARLSPISFHIIKTYLHPE